MPVRTLRAAALLLAGAVLCVHPRAAAAAAAADAGAAQAPAEPRPQDIVVTAPPLFRDIRPERELDQQGIASYGVSTIDELLGEVEVELGEDAEQPLILVNGERVSSLDDIAGLPVEVLRNLSVLPRGSAVRMGGTPGQRVISLTLNRRTRTATLTAAPKISTEGDWYAGRGEAILTSVKGSTRANLALRMRGESSLLESDRGIIQPDPVLPYAAQGNIIAYPTNLLDEIDPLLSLAAGRTVTVVPMPAGATPTLAQLAADANRAAMTDLGDFRTLRPRTRYYELGGTYATRLAPWLTGTASLRLSRNLGTSLRGLPTGLFVLSPDNVFSPFSSDVALAFYGRDPLRFRSRRDSGDASVTLNATFGKWLSNFNARYSQSRDVSRYDRQNLFGAIRSTIASTRSPPISRA